VIPLPALPRLRFNPGLTQKVARHPDPRTSLAPRVATVKDRERQYRRDIAAALGISIEALELLGADDEARRHALPD
jgi:hypothetical protein